MVPADYREMVAKRKIRNQSLYRLSRPDSSFYYFSKSYVNLVNQ